MFKQCLYWNIVCNSLPDGCLQHLGFIANFCKGTELGEIFKNKNNKTSFIIFTGTTSVDFKEITPIFTSQVIDALNVNGLEFYLYEPLSLYSVKHDDQYNKGYYSELSNQDQLKDIKAGELDDICKFVKRHNLTNVTVNTCDYNVSEMLGEQYPSISLCCNDLFIHTRKNIPSSSKSATKIKKRFWCANGRYTLHRHAIMSYLADKSGSYSWHYVCSESCVDYPLTWIDDSEISPKATEILRTGNCLLNSTYYYIDVKTNRDTISNPYYCFNGSALRNILNPKGWDTEYLSSRNISFVNIVNESRFSQPTGNISEKTLHAISTESPFILVAPPRSLEYIKKLGFKTFEKFWDESYDQEENHTIRLTKIFETIDYINSLSDREVTQMYNCMQDTLDYNKRVLLTLGTKSLKVLGSLDI